MVTRNNRTIALLLALVMVGSVLAAASVGSPAAAATDSAVDAPRAAGQSGAHAQEAGFDAESDCAATPPADGADPDADAIGWENGHWYNDSLDVDQSDGVQADEQEAIVARTMARVEAVRCIEFDDSVPVTIQSREEFREAQLERDVPDALRTFDNAKFEALFLIGESEDSIEVQNENRGAGILGYYDPRSDEIVVIADSPEALRIDELTLAHELVHAWQDQQFNITDDPFEVRLRDDANAVDGLVEGDASYTETLYQQRCGADWDCLEAQRGDLGDLANIGVYVLKFQPYSDGPTFVRLTRTLGGWDAVNALYERPPESAEQVIHPQRYGADPPTNVTLDDSATEEWERVRPPDRPDYASVGESALMSMFVYPLYDSGGQTEIVSPSQWFNQNRTGNISDFNPLNYESRYADGWDGDRLHVYENESGELGYVWRLTWDSPQDAQQFLEGYREVLRYRGASEIEQNTWRIDEGDFADAFYVRVDGSNVTIVNAPTVDQLAEIRPEVGPLPADDDAEANASAPG
ncbi:hypothetical protein BRC82_00195 [Halobacteriales archaeon QS_1_67_19]|nr:MAG: hypothetical protein BRC82_00195 [Halobacteriales archaeon QS_1_67_19]